MGTKRSQLKSFSGKSSLKQFARRLAEHGSSSKQIQAVSGHRTLSEIERYTRMADQGRLAKAAIGSLPDKE